MCVRFFYYDYGSKKKDRKKKHNTHNPRDSSVNGLGWLANVGTDVIVEISIAGHFPSIARVVSNSNVLSTILDTCVYFVKKKREKKRKKEKKREKKRGFPI